MPLGKSLIIAGLLLVAFGIVVSLAPRFPWAGRLPGDIWIERKNFTFTFPIVTSLILSVLLTILLNLFFRR